MAQSSRPLSPHLSVYRPQITMVMSIMHRITGVALYFGMALLVWWLAAASVGGEYLNFVNMVGKAWYGQLVMIGFTWALFNHMLGGIRHFVWDTGRGFSEKSRFGFAWFTLIGGFVLTALVWVFFVWM